MRRVAAVLAVAGLAAAALGACSTGATSAPSATTPVISDAWVRPPIGADRPAAGYLTIVNPGAAADTLVGVTSPIAMSCEIHETSMDSSGMAGMDPIDRLEIPAAGTVTLEPGGYHLMLMDAQPMTIGSTVELRLEFERAGTVVVQAEVREG